MLLDSMDEVGGWERGRLVGDEEEGIGKGEIEGRDNAIFGKLKGIEEVKKGIGSGRGVWSVVEGINGGEEDVALFREGWEVLGGREGVNAVVESVIEG
jgi:hypothetical protein